IARGRRGCDASPEEVMIVSLKPDADAEAVRRELTARGLWVTALSRPNAETGVHYVVEPHSAAVSVEEIARIDGVLAVSAPPSGHPRMDKQGPVLDVAGVRVGGAAPVFFCGPCAVESESQIFSLAHKLSAMGVRFLRGGAYKPRTSPYAFQGHGERALKWL